MAGETKYVLGFRVDTATGHVLLLEKARPAWQKGRLNGCGGKIEDAESPIQAMHREAREELDIRAPWRHFATLYGDGFIVWVFGSFQGGPWSATASEPGHVVDVGSLPSDCIPNLHWLIPMLVAGDNGEWPYLIRESGGGDARVGGKDPGR